MPLPPGNPESSHRIIIKLAKTKINTSCLSYPNHPHDLFISSLGLSLDGIYLDWPIRKVFAIPINSRLRVIGKNRLV